MVRQRLMGVLISGLLPAILAAQVGTPLVVDVIGAGSSGSWETDFEFANPEPVPMTAVVTYASTPLGGSCPPSCPFVNVVIPGNGTARLNAGPLGFGRFEVTRQGAGVLPSLTARWVNRANPQQSVEIPLVRRGSLLAADPSILSFPGATATTGNARSNLLIAHLSFTQTGAVLVEAFAANGDALGSRQLTLTSTPQVLRVLEFLRVTAALDAQIRVTRLSGDGPLWGYLITVGEDGTVTASSGLVP